MQKLSGEQAKQVYMYKKALVEYLSPIGTIVSGVQSATDPDWNWGKSVALSGLSTVPSALKYYGALGLPISAIAGLLAGSIGHGVGSIFRPKGFGKEEKGIGREEFITRFMKDVPEDKKLEFLAKYLA